MSTESKKLKLGKMKLNNITISILKVLDFFQFIKFCFQRFIEKVQIKLWWIKDILQKL